MTALAREEALARRTHSRPGGRTGLLAVARGAALVLLIAVCLGAVGLAARATFDEFLRRRAAVTGSTISWHAVPERVKARPADRGSAAVPPFDEFAVRAIVNSVPSPGGTGLPNIESVIIDSGSVVPLTINLSIEGVDNAAWNALALDERRRYADEVLGAIAAAYPEVEAAHGWSTDYYILDIWERFSLPLTADTADLDVICKPARHPGSRHQECRGGGLGAMVAVPVRHAA